MSESKNQRGKGDWGWEWENSYTVSFPFLIEVV